MSNNTSPKSLGNDQVWIDMDDQSGRVPSPEILSGGQVDESKPKKGAPNARGAGTPSKVDPEVIDTVRLPEPDRWDWRKPYEYPMVTGDPWDPLKNGAYTFDKEMCDAWNGELDTILTFTGLFSAAVTAFCIASFEALSQSPADTTNVFLIALSQQFANTSSPVAAFSMVEGFTPSAHDVYINVLYFISLTLALSVSSVCILGKQWIREYQRNISVSARDTVRVRQARFDSLEAWKVPQIMAALPVILLASLFLFFAGLLIQLWNASNHATAITVSIVVVCTTLMAMVTTIIPALYSLQPSRMAFTPFRSPQAWIFFVLYRRFQKWHHGIFQAYHEAPRTLANWSAFDHHFLTIEQKDSFEHGISSVHRSLRWAHEVLGNSGTIGKSVYQCFQREFHPHTLVPSEGHLSRYVLSGSDEDKRFDNPYRLCYNYSRTIGGWKMLNSPVGRYQAELLIRSTYYAMYKVKKPWHEIDHCFRQLHFFHGIFKDYSEQGIVQHQHIFQDQLALLFQPAFDIPPPSGSFDWNAIILCLLRARKDSSSPTSRQILRDASTQQIPGWIRAHKSASNLYNIAETTCSCAEDSWKPAIELFTQLDKVMAEMYHELEGLSGETVQKWRKLRKSLVRMSREGGDMCRRQAPEHLQLPDGHFDTIHGPLPPLSSPRNAQKIS